MPRKKVAPPCDLRPALSIRPQPFATLTRNITHTTHHPLWLRSSWVSALTESRRLRSLVGSALPSSPLHPSPGCSAIQTSRRPKAPHYPGLPPGPPASETTLPCYHQLADPFLEALHAPPAPVVSSTSLLVAPPSHAPAELRLLGSSSIGTCTTSRRNRRRRRRVTTPRQPVGNCLNPLAKDSIPYTVSSPFRR